MHVILDFDGTVTERDTIGVLASFAISYQQQQQGADLSAAWADILKEYAADHGRHVASYQPAELHRTSLGDEAAFLRSLRDTEFRSLERVHASGLFAGIPKALLEQAGREAVRRGEVKLRRGFGDFVREMTRDGKHEVSVLSVNWSASFVQGVLSTAGVGVQMDVVANEVGDSEDGRIRGPDSREGMVTSENKLEAAKHLLASRGGRKEELVYAGDSATDLECLVLGKGAVIADGPDGKLLHTLRRLGLNVQHVSTASREESLLVWARDFGEFRQWNVLSLR